MNKLKRLPFFYKGAFNQRRVRTSIQTDEIDIEAALEGAPDIWLHEVEATPYLFKEQLFSPTGLCPYLTLAKYQDN